MKGNGYNVVSLRGVFPLREQLRKIADSVSSEMDDRTTFDIVDFELMRQSLSDGSKNEWSEIESSWQPVDVTRAVNLLDSSYSFDPRVLDNKVGHSVITMPLPCRLVEDWSRIATHPRLKDFELSPDEIKFQVQMNAALLNVFAKSNAFIPNTNVSKSGFYEKQYDPRELLRGLLGIKSPFDEYLSGTTPTNLQTSPEQNLSIERTKKIEILSNNIFEELDIILGSAETIEFRARIRQWVVSQVTDPPEFLLFRYLDCDVEPGNSYRYRVRLHLKLFKPLLVDGSPQSIDVTREVPLLTDWSDATAPVFVIHETNYFLTHIRSAIGYRTVLPTAFFEVFQWDPAFGTLINGSFEVQMGQFISGEDETEISNAATKKTDVRNFQFESTHFLVDVIEDIEIDRNFHSNDRLDQNLRLDLMRGHRNHFRNDSRALIKNNHGLVEHSQAALRKKHQYHKVAIKLQRDQFELSPQNARRNLLLQNANDAENQDQTSSSNRESNPLRKLTNE